MGDTDNGIGEDPKEAFRLKRKVEELRQADAVCPREIWNPLQQVDNDVKGIRRIAIVAGDVYR